LTTRTLNHGGDTVDPTTLIRWIERAKKGDIGSYQKIYDLFARKVLNFIYRMVGLADQAEDLTQETFVAVYQKLGSLRDNARFEPWLFRIARNFVYQSYRGRSAATVSIDANEEAGQLAMQIADARKDPDQSFQARELEQVVARIIADLPEKYREVFALAAIQGFSYQRIAEIVGRSLPSVKTDIHRARLEVRKRVKDYLKV